MKMTIGLMQSLEKLPGIAWIRIELHDDTEIAILNGNEELILAGESIVICTSRPASELEALAKCDWLCSGGLEEWEPSVMDSVFSHIPTVPNGFRCFSIVWD